MQGHYPHRFWFITSCSKTLCLTSTQITLFDHFKRAKKWNQLSTIQCKIQFLFYSFSFKENRPLFLTTTKILKESTIASVMQVAIQMFSTVSRPIRNNTSKFVRWTTAPIILEMFAYFANPSGLKTGNPKMYAGNVIAITGINNWRIRPEERNSSPNSKTQNDSANIHTNVQPAKIIGMRTSNIFLINLKSLFCTICGYKLSAIGENALLAVVISFSADV